MAKMMIYSNLFKICPVCKSSDINYNEIECWCARCGHCEKIFARFVPAPLDRRFYTINPLLNELNLLSNHLSLPDFIRKDVFYITTNLHLPKSRDHLYLAGCILIYIFRHYQILTPRLAKEIRRFAMIRRPKKTLREIEEKNQFRWELPKRYRKMFLRRLNESV